VKLLERVGEPRQAAGVIDGVWSVSGSWSFAATAQLSSARTTKLSMMVTITSWRRSAP
jgi:hypothetical protein